jgi:anti-sigma-K factor RskA
MTDHSPHHEELLAGYVLGTLDGGDLREIEEHLATGCEECQRQLDLWRGDLEELAGSIPPATPSPETRRSLLRRVEAEQRRRARRRPWTRAALPAAAVLAVLVWGGWRQARLVDEIDRLGAERGRLAQQVSALEFEVRSARTELAEALTILGAPRSHSVRLAGLDPTPGASGYAFVDPRQGKAVFYAFHLPAVATGKTYELWWIAGGRPVRAGTFDVDGEGNGRLRVEGVAPGAEVPVWAVTVEPWGGTDQPTGPMVLKG